MLNSAAETELLSTGFILIIAGGWGAWGVKNVYTLAETLVGNVLSWLHHFFYPCQLQSDACDS